MTSATLPAITCASASELFNRLDYFGQGADLASTLELQGILESKGHPPIVDIWGYDVAHDWIWWEKQWTYFLQMTLGNPLRGARWIFMILRCKNAGCFG